MIGQGHGRAKLAPVVKQKTTELKQQHPHFGVKKITQVLRRVLFLPVSRETVRRTLQAQPPLKKPKPQRHPPQPRFFERTTPNQLWPIDIFTFRLGGKVGQPTRPLPFSQVTRRLGRPVGRTGPRFSSALLSADL